MGKLNINRKRWAIVRDGKDGLEIICGEAKSQYFYPVSDTDRRRVKTYSSESKARDAVKFAPYCSRIPCRIIPVCESIVEIDQEPD